MSLIIYIVFINFFTFITALKCYQGTFNTTLPIHGNATECITISKAVSCIAQYNSEMSLATLSCDDKNCTLLPFHKDNRCLYLPESGLPRCEIPPPSEKITAVSMNPGYYYNEEKRSYINGPICANISRDQTNCCCYTNGCNAAMLNKAMGKEIILPTTPATKPNSPPQNPTKPTNSSVKLSSSSTNSANAKELQLGGFFFLSHSECQKLCNQSLLKCVAYLYEEKNRGKCTLFQNFVDVKVTKSPNSTAVAPKKN